MPVPYLALVVQLGLHTVLLMRALHVGDRHICKHSSDHCGLSAVWSLLDADLVRKVARKKIANE